MTQKEKSLNNLNADYQYLRFKGVCAKTALKMLAIAYREHLRK